MNRRFILTVALLATAATASVAHAATVKPATGSWAAPSAADKSGVRFGLQTTSNGYQVRSLRVRVPSPCASPNPRRTKGSRLVDVNGANFPLTASGNRLTGSIRVANKSRSGKTALALRVKVTVVSPRRAKVSASARYSTRNPGTESNTANCKGRLALTAKPR